MPPKHSLAISHPTPSSTLMQSQEPIIEKMTPAQLESYYAFVLSECNRLAKTTEHIPRNIAMAKMVNCCIRMLHSHGWMPHTVVRAMVHMEAGSEGTLMSILHRSMRERRDEGRARRASRALTEIVVGESNGNKHADVTSASVDPGEAGKLVVGMPNKTSSDGAVADADSRVSEQGEISDDEKLKANGETK